MRTTKAKTPAHPPFPGTVHANVQIPEALHNLMWDIRDARHRLEGADVKLSRIYREAVEQYIQAEPQQKLLNGRRQKALRNSA